MSQFTAKPAPARKLFRIEGERRPAAQDEHAGSRHAEVMRALAELRELAQPSHEVSQGILEEHRRDLREAMLLKQELEAISRTILQTKQEIATLHYAGAQGREMSRVTDELGAIVLGTEEATNTILASAESIDELAGNLAARVGRAHAGMATEISERVVSIFEACNFQDITGQRIGKVVNAMRFIEERVDEMIRIWGGLESFNNVTLLTDPSRSGDAALLNGPALAQDADATSQDDIDSLFG